MSSIKELKLRRKAQIRKSRQAWEDGPLYEDDESEASSLTTLMRIMMDIADDAASQGEIEFQVVFDNDTELYPLIEQLRQAKYGVKQGRTSFGPPCYRIKEGAWHRDESRQYTPKDLSIRIN